MGSVLLLAPGCVFVYSAAGVRVQCSVPSDVGQ